MFKTPNAYSLSLDMPGCSMADVTVLLEEGGEVLRVEGKRPARGVKPEGPLMRWRFEVSRDVDTSLISARMAHGTLNVDLPILQKAQAQTIRVTSGDEPQHAQQQQAELPMHAHEEDMSAEQQAADAAAEQESAEQADEPDVLIEEEADVAPGDAAPSAASIDNTHVSIS